MTTFREYLDRTANANAAVSRPTPMPAGARALQGERAGFVTRVVAAIIDALLIFVIVLATVAALWMLSFLINPVSGATPVVEENARRVPPVLVMIFYGYFLNWLYWTITWATSGRTVGNLIMGIRVIDRHGNHLGWFVAAVRSAFCTVFPLGLLWAVVSNSNRSVQDVVLRTSVIYDWVVGLPTLSEIFKRTLIPARPKAPADSSADSSAAN